MVCSINALEQLQCWEREWWTPGINYNLTMQSHNSKSSSLHFIFKLNQKRIFAQDIYHFHCHIRSWFLKGGVPIFYDFCNNALEPLPPIIGLFLYIFLQLTSICMKRIYAWSQSKNHYTISFWIVGHFQTTPTADCEKMITFKVI